MEQIITYVEETGFILLYNPIQPRPNAFIDRMSVSLNIAEQIKEETSQSVFVYLSSPLLLLFLLASPARVDDSRISFNLKSNFFSNFVPAGFQILFFLFHVLIPRFLVEHRLPMTEFSFVAPRLSFYTPSQNFVHGDLLVKDERGREGGCVGAGGGVGAEKSRINKSEEDPYGHFYSLTL